MIHKRTQKAGSYFKGEHAISCGRAASSTGTFLILLFIAVFFCTQLFVGTVIHIEGTSMYPTFDDGDFIFGTIVSDNTELNVGDIVTLKEGNRMLIKRIHGLPGQTIENPDIGIPLTTLAENEYYVVGDNYENSNDSRILGPIRRADIVFKYTGIRWTTLTLALTFFLPLILLAVVLTLALVPSGETPLETPEPTGLPGAAKHESDPAPALSKTSTKKEVSL